MKNALLLMLVLPLTAFGQGLPPETLKRIKDATVFIIVRGERQGGTGSGFVVRQDKDDTYIVTNNHVIDFDHEIRAAGGTPKSTSPARISVVFDSGMPSERTAKATIMAADPERDLAVLKVTKVKNPPQPLDLDNPPPLVETMRLFVCGFPFGDELGEGKHPEITISGGGVSSIRRDVNGRVASVQIDGSLNHGNSGGPVVSATDGKLIGVAVRSIIGKGIGYAVPQAEVIRMLGGRPGQMKIVPKDPEATKPGPATLHLNMIDPLRVVKGAVAHYRVGLPQMKEGQVMPESKKIDLAIMDGVATAEIESPAKGIMMVQIELQLPTGPLLTSPEIVRIGVSRAPTPNPDMVERTPRGSGKPRLRAKDGHIVELPAFPLREKPKSSDSATSLSDFSLKPDSYLDKTITIEGLSDCQVNVLPDSKYELTVLTEAGNAPSNVRVILPKDLGLQLSEVYVRHGLDFTYAIRLDGRVAKPAKSGDSHLLEVSELHFLDDEGKSVSSLKPAAVVPGGDSTLSVVNRFPADFKGKSVTLKAHLDGLDNSGFGTGLKVNHPSLSPVRNLKFFIASDLATQVTNDIPSDGGAMVELEGTVEDVDGKTGQGILAVKSISVLDGEGKSKKKLEGRESISLPRASAPVIKPAEATKPLKPDVSASVSSRRAPVPAVETKPETSNLTLYLGIGGVAGLLIIGAGVLVLLKGRNSGTAPKNKYQRKGDTTESAAKPKYQRRAEAVIEDEAPASKPAPRPAAKPVSKPAPAAKPRPAGDDNPFANLG